MVTLVERDDVKAVAGKQRQSFIQLINLIQVQQPGCHPVGKVVCFGLKPVVHQLARVNTGRAD